MLQRVDDSGALLERVLRHVEAIYHDTPIEVAYSDLAAEMLPWDVGMGELRTNYAGFFDCGFGWGDGRAQGARAVLEVRPHDAHPEASALPCPLPQGGQASVRHPAPASAGQALRLLEPGARRHRDLYR